MRQFTFKKKEIILPKKVKDMGRGSGIRKKLIPDTDTGAKKAPDRGFRIVSPDPQQWLDVPCYLIEHEKQFSIPNLQEFALRIPSFNSLKAKRNADLGTVTYFQCSY